MKVAAAAATLCVLAFAPADGSAQAIRTIEARRDALAAAWAHRGRTSSDSLYLDPCSAYWAVVRDVPILPDSIWPSAPLALRRETACPPSEDTTTTAHRWPHTRVQRITLSPGVPTERATIVIQIFEQSGNIFAETFELARASGERTWRIASTERRYAGDVLYSHPASFLILIDDVLLRSANRDSALAAIPPGEIVSLELLAEDDPRATARYGSAARKGILVVRTRRAPRP